MVLERSEVAAGSLVHVGQSCSPVADATRRRGRSRTERLAVEGRDARAADGLDGPAGCAEAARGRRARPAGRNGSCTYAAACRTPPSSRSTDARRGRRSRPTSTCSERSADTASCPDPHPMSAVNEPMTAMLEIQRRALTLAILGRKPQRMNGIFELPARAVHCARVRTGSGGVDRLAGWTSQHSRHSRSRSERHDTPARRSLAGQAGGGRVPPALRVPQLPRPRRAAPRPLRRSPAPGHRARRDRHRRPALRRRVRTRREDPVSSCSSTTTRKRPGPPRSTSPRGTACCTPARGRHRSRPGSAALASTRPGKRVTAARRDLRARPGRSGAVQPRRHRQHRPRAGSRRPRRGRGLSTPLSASRHLRLLRHARRDPRLGPVVAGDGRRGRLRAARRTYATVGGTTGSTAPSTTSIRSPREHYVALAAGRECAACSPTAASRTKPRTCSSPAVREIGAHRRIAPTRRSPRVLTELRAPRVCGSRSAPTGTGTSTRRSTRPA